MRRLCFIGQHHCQSRTIHDHHVHMKALTGEAGDHVDLCGSCHTDLHAVANARVAKIRGGKPNPQNLVWPHARHPLEQRNAELLIGALIHTMLSVDSSGLNKAMSVSVPPEISRGLGVLKKKLRLSTKQEAALYCCEQVLRHLGLLQK